MTESSQGFTCRLQCRTTKSKGLNTWLNIRLSEKANCGLFFSVSLTYHFIKSTLIIMHSHGTTYFMYIKLNRMETKVGEGQDNIVH